MAWAAIASLGVKKEQKVTRCTAPIPDGMGTPTVLEMEAKLEGDKRHSLYVPAVTACTQNTGVQLVSSAGGKHLAREGGDKA